MRIAITGSSGFLGNHLSVALRSEGHAIGHLVRHEARSDGEIAWNPEAGTIDGDRVEGYDAVVHLAGEPISRHWTETRKRRIRQSRVAGTALVAETLAALSSPPRVLLSASAIGYYGDRGDIKLDESSGPGSGFLAEVCQAWEEAADPARRRGVRVAHLRTGIVLGRDGGALPQLLRPFRLGLGGKIGNGRQFMSWITISDWVRSVLFLLKNETIAGPVNLVGPAPVTNADFARMLGRLLGRPAWMPLPRIAVRALLGEMGEELLLASQRVVPKRLFEAGFTFQHPSLESALRSALDSDRSRGASS